MRCQVWNYNSQGAVGHGRWEKISPFLGGFVSTQTSDDLAIWYRRPSLSFVYIITLFHSETDGYKGIPNSSTSTT